MRLTENIRIAERESLANVRRQIDRAKQEWSDVERRIRQRMRVYPQKLRSRIGVVHEPVMDQGTLDAETAAVALQGSKPIISINGQDVPGHEIEKTMN